MEVELLTRVMSTNPGTLRRLRAVGEVRMPEDDDLRDDDDLRGRVEDLEEAVKALLLERGTLTQEINYLRRRNHTVESALAAAAALFVEAAGEATDADVQERPSS